MKNRYLKTFYTRLTCIFMHEGMDEAAARKKAYTTTLLLAGIICFFVYAFLMNMLNQLFFEYPNTRTQGYLVVAPFVLIFYLLVGRKMLQPFLRQVEIETALPDEELRRYRKYYNRMILFIFLYGTGMFVLIRGSNIYLF